MNRNKTSTIQAGDLVTFNYNRRQAVVAKKCKAFVRLYLGHVDHPSGKTVPQFENRKTTELSLKTKAFFSAKLLKTMMKSFGPFKKSTK
jgi:hypothetical protein